jgi:predicted transcriptional regulator
MIQHTEASGLKVGVDLLMSIIPMVGRRIMSGKKKYEYRRSIFRKPVNRVYLYLSSPERKIVGYFKYRGYMEGTIREIWEATKEVSAATEAGYLEYFQNTNRAFAIRIDEFINFAEPLDPRKMPSPTPGSGSFLPPQSFYYVKAGFYGS